MLTASGYRALHCGALSVYRSPAPDRAGAALPGVLLAWRLHPIPPPLPSIQDLESYARPSVARSVVPAPQHRGTVRRALGCDGVEPERRLLADAPALHPGGGSAGAPVHHPARLRARIVLSLAGLERSPRRNARRPHAGALRLLEEDARHASRHLGGPEPPRLRRRRHLDRPRVPRALEVRPPALPDSPQPLRAAGGGALLPVRAQASTAARHSA